MTTHKARWLLAFLSLAFPAAARAQGIGAPLTPAAPALTAAQLTAFAELMGETKPVVWQHLLADPGLAPLAAAAADVRIERKSSGKTMTIAGFTILGVGAGVGYAIMVSGIMSGANCNYYDNYNSQCGPNTDRMMGGLVVGILSVGVGLAIGIPGIIRMARQTELETQASERYQAWGSGQPLVYPGAYSQSLPMRSPGRRLDLSLLSFRF
jgi:hypothetical protein